MLPKFLNFPDRCKMPAVILDISGSQCVGYSTLGKKDNGTLQREESKHNVLLLIWVIYHGRAQTPILMHENLRNFSIDYLKEKLAHFHYVHIGTINTAAGDCGLTPNSRKRRYLVSILARNLCLNRLPGLHARSFQSEDIDWDSVPIIPHNRGKSNRR